MKYEFEISETLRKTVFVKAKDKEEAFEKVQNDYYSGKIVLTADDYGGECDITLKKEYNDSRIYILIGKSAVGKSTVLDEMCKRGIKRVVSYTTRPMRTGEVDGVDYRFISEQEFLDKLTTDGFIEYRRYETLVNGKPAVWYYGTGKDRLDDGDYVIVLDVEGAKNFIEFYHHNHLQNCFIAYLVADAEVREKRAKRRGSFDESEWNRRLEDDEVKFLTADDICNEKLDTTYSSPAEIADTIIRVAEDKYYGWE